MSERITGDLIYQEFKDKVSRYVRSRIGNFHDAEDLISDVFLKATAALERFDRQKGSLSTWVYTITQNTVRDYFRRAKPIYSLDEQEDLPDPADPIDAELLSRERLNELAAALETLSQRERDIIILRFYLGLSPKDIAQRMQISYSNEGFIQSTALRKLRKALAGTLEA